MKNKLLIILEILLLLAMFCIGFMFSYNRQANTNSDTTEIASQTNLSDSAEPTVVELPKKEDSHLNISVIGDIMCHNSQYIDAYVSSQDTYDFSYVFDEIKDYVSTADIAIGNLETTFAGKERGYSNYPTFNTPEQLATNLKDLGIDVLSTANNHSMDKGYNGLVSTLDFLDNARIDHMGTYRTPEEQNTILIKEVNNIKIAFLSFTYGTNGIPVPASKPYCINLIDENLIKAQLDLAKEQKPDLICVNMHWGTEYQNRQNETQENLANLLFENGVDIILGSHPHVLQPMEKRSVVLENGITKNCFVIYSLGNFMSGQTKEYTKSSIILNMSITKDGNTDNITIDDISYVPIYMHKSAKGPQKYRILDIEKSISNYEAGTDTSIGQATYSTIKKEFERIKSLMGNL